MSRFYPENPQVERECLVCGQIFIGKKNSLYCSKQCQKAVKKDQKEYNQSSNARKNKFARLVNYVKEHNLKEILKKYKPETAA